MPTPDEHPSTQRKDWGFACAVLGVPPPSPDVRIAFIPIPESQVLRLAELFRGKLSAAVPDPPTEVEQALRQEGTLGTVSFLPQLDFPGYPPLHAHIERLGQTAIMAQWVHHMTIDVGTGRRSGSVQAISLYLTGLDPDADRAALDLCRAKRFGPDGRHAPVPPPVYERILDDNERPLAVQICMRPLARVDPSIRCAYLALGTAFFGLLGVGIERP